LCARVRFEFEHEALARAGDGGRLYYTSIEDDDFAGFGIDLRRRAGGVDYGCPDADEEEPETAAEPGQNARAAQGSDESQGDENGGEQPRFGRREGDETGGEDAQSDGGTGAE
jgi:hypothetical protein